MIKRIYFTENVLFKNLEETKDVLSHLRLSRRNLIAISELSIDEERKLLEEANIRSYFASLVPNVKLENVDAGFLDQLRKNRSVIDNYSNNICWERPSSILLEECALISSDLKTCQTADNIFFKNFYYNEGEKDVVGGKHIKSLTTLKYIF